MSKTFRRGYVREIPTIGRVHIMVMSGYQRDIHTGNQLELRERVRTAMHMTDAELDLIPEKDRAIRMTEVIRSTPDLLRDFNQQQYALIAWCAADADTQEPLFSDGSDAASRLDYEQAAELAQVCAEVNKLTAESAKETQLDFFEGPKSESGSN